MQTIVARVDPENPDPEVIARAGGIIRNGGLVAFPTETVYGLAADALNEAAVRRVYEAKGRPAGKPLAVQVAEKEDIKKLARSIPAAADRLIDAYFPGPLTIILEASPAISEIVTASTGKIGIRMPDHPVALALIRSAGTPIVAPSANTSGKPAPTDAAGVLRDLDGRVDMVLDAGTTSVKVASTVLDLTLDPPKILREGVIGMRELSRYF